MLHSQEDTLNAYRGVCGYAVDAVENVREDLKLSISKTEYLASTLPPEEHPDSDYSVGVLIARTRDGHYIIEDMIRGRWRADEIENMLVERLESIKQNRGY